MGPLHPVKEALLMSPLGNMKCLDFFTQAKKVTANKARAFNLEKMAKVSEREDRIISL